MLRSTVLAAIALLSSAPLFAQARTTETVLMNENENYRAFQEQYGFSDAVIAGDLIFLSGVVAGPAAGETDMAPAYERVFRQIGRTLERAGAGYGDVVDMTSFHTDIKAQITALSEISKRFLGSPPPAWTAIEVVRLLPDNGVTEIKIIARRPTAARQQ